MKAILIKEHGKYTAFLMEKITTEKGENYLRSQTVASTNEFFDYNSSTCYPIRKLKIENNIDIPKGAHKEIQFESFNDKILLDAEGFAIIKSINEPEI